MCSTGEGDGKAYLVPAERCLLHPGVGNHVHQRDPQHLRPRGKDTHARGDAVLLHVDSQGGG